MLDLKTSSSLKRSKYTFIGRHSFLVIFDSAYWLVDRAFSHCNLTNPRLYSADTVAVYYMCFTQPQRGGTAIACTVIEPPSHGAT